MENITSIKHEYVQEARYINSAKGRTEKNKCLLENFQNIQWAINSNWKIQAAFIVENYHNEEELKILNEKNINCYIVSSGIMKKITGRNYKVSISAIAHIPSRPSAKEDFVVALDHVVDHGNIGTIIRSASGFGIKDLHLVGQPAELYYKRVMDASRGKIFDAKLTGHSTSLEMVNDLKQKGYEIIATSPHATTVQSETKLSGHPIALIVGNETDGISDEIFEHADIVVQIPMTGNVESLNVGVAAGISIYEFKLKLVLAMLVKTIRSTLGREVNVTAQLIQSVVDKKLEKISSINGKQSILLMVMACDKKMSKKEIAETVKLWDDDLTQLLTELEQQALISHNDALYKITEKGEQQLSTIWNIIEALEQEILNDFTEEEQQELFNYLKRVQNNCINIIEI